MGIIFSDIYAFLGWKLVITRHKITALCHEVRACEGCEDVSGVAAGVELAPPQPRGVVPHAAAGPRPRAAASLLAPAVVVHLAAPLLRTRDTLLRRVTRDSDAAHLPAADLAAPREDHGVALEAGALGVLAVAEHPCSRVKSVSCLISRCRYYIYRSRPHGPSCSPRRGSRATPPSCWCP